MVIWGRHLKTLMCQAGKKIKQNVGPTSCYHHQRALLAIGGEVLPLKTLWRSSSPNISRPLFNYVPQLAFTSSRLLLAKEETPVCSPLNPVAKAGKEGLKPLTVQAVLKKIKQSPKKVNLVAALIRGMRVDDALLLLQVTVKRAAKTVYQVIHSARANAVHNHGLDPSRLLVSEAFLGKGAYTKRVWPHGRGKSGIRVRPECRLTVVVRESTPDEENDIARLKVNNFRKLNKHEKRLVPFKLIETTPYWNRKTKKSPSS